MPKRRRTEEPAAQEDTPMDTTPRPSKKVWFEDGNIILQAGNLQFKVHRGVLAKQSPVFADLFQIPHPPGEPTVEGCPVVELHDEAEDLEHALLALYGDASHVGTKDKPNLSALAAMIRLGRKYEISYLRDEGLARLKREFPTTLEEYDRLPEEYLSFTYPETQCGLDPIVDIIKLAHECNIQSILPALYLQATSWKLDELLYRPDCSSIPFRALCNIISGRDELLNARKDLVSGFSQCDQGTLRPLWTGHPGTVASGCSRTLASLTDMDGLFRKRGEDVKARFHRYRPKRSLGSYAIVQGVPAQGAGGAQSGKEGRLG